MQQDALADSVCSDRVGGGVAVDAVRHRPRAVAGARCSGAALLVRYMHALLVSLSGCFENRKPDRGLYQCTERPAGQPHYIYDGYAR